MRIGQSRHVKACVAGLALLLVVGANGGCVGLVGLDSDLLANLGLASNPLAEEGGNVVISCVNHTQSAVQWRLAWQQSGTDEATRLAVTIEPAKSKTLSVEGTVERIAVGSLDGWSVAAVIDPSGADPHTVTYSGVPLENGVDFRNGDIIRYSISDSGSGKYHISAEVSHGG